MSYCNTHFYCNPPFTEKAVRREQRRVKKALPSKLRHLGIAVRAVDVRNHRYLKSCGLDYSPELAAVSLKKAVVEDAAPRIHRVESRVEKKITGFLKRASGQLKMLLGIWNQKSG